MGDLGKALIGMGVFVVLIGLLLVVAARLNLPLGRLPGDFAWRSKSGNGSFYFPLATCLLVSILLSVLFWIIGALRK
jgi:cell division protein FtsX